MINWPVTREDISVWCDEDQTLWIRVGDDINNFMVSAKGDGAIMPAIKQISEMIQRKVLGITEHDFIIKVNDLFISEKEKGD